MRGIGLALLGTCLLVGDPSVAQPVQLPTALLSIGYVEAKLSDFVKTAGYEKRLTDPTGYLAASADFRGDGRADQARILRNTDRGIAYIVVVIVREKIDTYVVKSVPLAEADNLGLRVAEPASHDRKAFGLTIFKLDGHGAETFDLAGDDFAKRPSP